MKKILILMTAVVCSTLVYSQEVNNELTELAAPKVNNGFEFHYGFKIGLNFCTYSSDADDFQCRPGQYGICCRLQFGRFFALQPEVFYARQGIRSLEFIIEGHEDADDPYYPNPPGTPRTNDEEKYRLMLLNDCFQMPIMCKFYIPFRLPGINIQAGPLFSQRFDYKVSSPSPASLLANPCFPEKVNRDLSKNAFARDQHQATMGVNWGIGYDSDSGIGVDLRLYTGITRVFKTVNTHSRDRVWSISFTYMF